MPGEYLMIDSPLFEKEDEEEVEAVVEPPPSGVAEVLLWYLHYVGCIYRAPVSAHYVRCIYRASV